MTQNGEEVYKTAEEAMEYLHISRPTLDRLARRGRIKKYKRDVSRRVYFKKSELDTLTEFRPMNKSEET